MGAMARSDETCGVGYCWANGRFAYPTIYSNKYEAHSRWKYYLHFPLLYHRKKSNKTKNTSLITMDSIYSACYFSI